MSADEGRLHSAPPPPGFAVSIDPDAINRYLSDRILESALGERLTQTIDDALKGLGQYGNDPLKNAVVSQVQEAVRELVSTEHAERIREAVRTSLTDEVIDKFAATVAASLTREARF
jgi:hypothetical protein